MNDEIANLVAKLSLDTSGFTSSAAAIDTDSVQKSIQSAVDDIDIDRHFTLASEANDLYALNDQLNLIQEIQDEAFDMGKKIFDAGVNVVTVARDIETAWVGVTKTVNAPEGVDPDAFFGELKAEVYQMSTEMPRTFQEIAAAMSAAGQVGVKPEMLHDYTEAMLQFESATNGAIKADDAAMVFQKFMNVTGGAQENISNLASTVVALGNNTSATEKSILDMATRISGISNNSSFTDAQIMGWSAALSSVGLEAGRAGTAFTGIVEKIKEAVSTGNSNLETFAAVSNKTAEEFAEDFGKDASGTLQQFFTDLGNASEENLSVLYSATKDLGINQSQAKDILLKLSSATDTVADSLSLAESAYSENAALANEAAAANDTLDAQLQMFQNTITAIQGQLGDSLLPIIKDIGKAILPIIQDVTSFIAEHPALASDITGIAIALEGVSIAAQFASVAMTMGAVGLAPWVGAVAIIGALVGVVVLLADAFGEVDEKAAEAAKNIENIDTATQNLTQNGFGQMEIVDYGYLTAETSGIDMFGNAYEEGDLIRWSELTGEIITQQYDLARAGKTATEAIEEQQTVISELSDSIANDSPSEQLTQNAETTENAVKSTDDILSQLNDQMNTFNEMTGQISTTMDEGLTDSMEQLNTMLESQAFQQFANQPIDPEVAESWTAFSEAVSQASEGFTGITGLTGEDTGTLALDIEPIPEDVTTSYKTFGDAVAAINKAVNGGEDEEGNAFAGLSGALAALPDKFAAVKTSAIELSNTFTGEMVSGIETLLQHVAMVKMDDNGEMANAGGNTLYNALGEVKGLFESILGTSRLLAEQWRGEFISASEAMRAEAGGATGTLTALAGVAGSTAGQFATLAAQIRDVVDALGELRAAGGVSGAGATGSVIAGGAANGAHVHAGESWMIGEDGPEIFTPSRSGYVIPNDEWTGRKRDEPQIVVNVGEVYGESYLKRFVVDTMTGAIRKELRLAA